jgi:transposase-like protein
MDIKIPAPVPGEDYPRNWNEFFDWFATEQACLAYLERLRWPQGFVCSSCGSANQPYRSSRARLMCQECGHQSTVCAGTIFDKTRTPLRVWLSAAWYLTNQKQGVSALGLQRVLGLGSYQTAWTMLHRFRRAMVRQGRQRLKGQVEVDETYLVKNAQRSKTVKVLSSVSVSASPPIGGGFFCWSAAGVHGGLLVNAQGVVLSTRTPLLALIEKASVHPSLRAL